MPRPHRPKLRLALLATATLLLLFSITTWIAGFLPKTPTFGWHSQPGHRNMFRGFEITAIAGRLFLIRQSGSIGFVDHDGNGKVTFHASHERFGGESPAWGWNEFQQMAGPNRGNGFAIPGFFAGSNTTRINTAAAGTTQPITSLQLSYTTLSIHAAYGIALSALLFAWLYLPRLRRPPPHACPHCHYDLRATPDPHGPLLPTCPECGHTTPPPHPQNSPPLSDTLSP